MDIKHSPVDSRAANKFPDNVASAAAVGQRPVGDAKRNSADVFSDAAKALANLVMHTRCVVAAGPLGGGLDERQHDVDVKGRRAPA